MNIWGERYADVDLFISHCRDLNVKIDRRELEHYEKIGVMMPVARVVYPKEFVIQEYRDSTQGVVDSNGKDKWPALERLSEEFGPFLYGYEGLSDEELVHCFDRELEAGDNPHLILPACNRFKPWSEYRVTVHDKQGDVLKRPGADHYYSYWQVHQLYRIQQFPDLYKNTWLIQRIPDDDPKKKFLPSAISKELLVSFEGLRHSFDALTFWTTGYDRESKRTFATIPEKNGVRYLSKVEAANHRNRLADFAARVTKQFQLTPNDMYYFLRKLINLFEQYKSNERYRLAEELRKDIFQWEGLLTLTLGMNRDEIAEQLGKVSRSDKQAFRWLDRSTKERDYALDLLVDVAKRSTKALRQLGDSKWTFVKSDAEDLLCFCQENGLGIFITALSGMAAIGEEEARQKFRRVQRYTNLKNALTSYEYFLKSLALNSGCVSGGETLTPLVNTIMKNESWHKLFESRMQSGKLKGNATQDFLSNLATLLADQQLSGSADGFWARNFLVMCLARNMAVHSYPREDEYYGNLFGPMLDAAITATFYTWRHAKAKSWT